MGLWTGVADAVDSAWQGFRTRPNLRQVYLRVLAEDEPEHRRFEPEKCYATIRLVELRLAEAGRYLSEFLPMCACFIRQGQGDAQRTIPVVFGAETIRGGLGARTPKDVGRNLAVANLDMVSKLPVRADGLTIYTSLCRFRDDSLTSGLLGFAAEAAKAVGGEAYAAPVRVASDLTTKLQSLLGSGEVETRFARLDGDPLRESGHRLLAASVNNSLGSELIVRDGQVLRRTGSNEHNIDDVDYLLLEFQHIPTLVDEDFAHVRSLPFHQIYDQAEQAIIEKHGQPSQAVDDLMTKLEMAIFASPALVRRDRFWLIQMYSAARRKLEASYHPVLASGDTLPELTALFARQGQEAHSGSPIASILDSAQTAIGEVLLTSRESKPHAPTTDRELATIASALIAAQPLEYAADEEIEAASIAYAGTLRAR